MFGFSRDSPKQYGMLSAAQIISLYLAYENLLENRAQSRHNDVQVANDQQANYILEELGRKFDEQNVMLRGMQEDLKTIKKFLGLR